jgi:hypothetical protein
MRISSGRSTLLSDILYVPRLGINLMSSRKICSQGVVLGSFNDKTIYFKKGNKTLIRADISSGIYIISWIRKGLNEKEFTAQAPPRNNLTPPPGEISKPLESINSSPNSRTCRIDTPMISQVLPKGSLLEPIAKQEVIKPALDSEGPRYTHQVYRAESDSSLSSSDNGSKTKKESEREVRERYELMHRRFGHYSPEKLKKLYKVSNVQKVRIPRNA